MRFVLVAMVGAWVLDQIVAQVMFRRRVSLLIDQAEADLMFAAAGRGPRL
jgi:hypothetical protein